MLRKSRSIHHRGAGVAPACLSLFVVCLCLLGFAPPARAGLVATGDVIPANPATWTSSTDAYIGYSSSGTLNITGGGAVSSCHSNIGCNSGSTGEVTVDGAGSTWTIGGSFFFVGYSGSGTLNITGGGVVSNNYAFIGYDYGSTGMVTVDGAGSTWTNGDYLYVGRNGNGTLRACGKMKIDPPH